MSTHYSNSQHGSSQVSNFDVIPFDMIWEYINDPIDSQIKGRFGLKLKSKTDINNKGFLEGTLEGIVKMLKID
jgi:hypothetical protein